jgi:hypothetical protein
MLVYLKLFISELKSYVYFFLSVIIVSSCYYNISVMGHKSHMYCHGIECGMTEVSVAFYDLCVHSTHQVTCYYDQCSWCFPWCVCDKYAICISIMLPATVIANSWELSTLSSPSLQLWGPEIIDLITITVLLIEKTYVLRSLHLHSYYKGFWKNTCAHLQEKNISVHCSFLTN